MATTNLDEEEIVRLLTLYLQDDGVSLGNTYGPEAVTAVEDMRDFIKERLDKDERNLTLWQDFEDEPATTGVELTGWLEAFDESDPELATRLNGLYQEFVESSRRANPLRSATDRADDVVEDDVNTAETPVLLQSNDDEYPEDETYMVGSIEGHDEYTPGNTGLNDTSAEQSALLNSIDEPDTLEIINDSQGTPGLFESLHQALHDYPGLTHEQRDAVADLLNQMETEVARGEQADEDALIHAIRHLRRIAPDILDVMLPGLDGFASEIRGPFQRALRRIERQEEQAEGSS